MELSTSDIDSIVSKTEKFINSEILRIELIKILPKCRKVKFFNDNGDKILEKECDNETIIKKEYIKNKNWKVELEEKLIGQKTEIKKSDFTIFLNSLFNQKTDIEDYTVDSCYAPRHGIIFYDSNENIDGFFEICFECSNYKIVGEIPRFILLSKSKFNKLSELFDKYDMKE
ncbi:hypothetical protein ACSIGC_09220 [Tenacibaculum sp. ZS6-P6]|uniref:hypothetical protein n=1 Tax=Tenacibaculum sp. ZS6-P6 TaxID=3447503 RepID=UPI003F96743A